MPKAVREKKTRAHAKPLSHAARFAAAAEEKVNSPTVTASHNTARHEETFTVERTVQNVEPLALVREAKQNARKGRRQAGTETDLFDLQDMEFAPDSDAAPEVAKGKKRDKRQQRHDRWMEKLGGVYKKDGKKKKKQDVGSLNLETLTDFLPSLAEHRPFESIMGATQPSVNGLSPVAGGTTASDTSNRSKPKAKGPVSQSARRKAGVSEILRLQKVLRHPTFKSNPLATVRQHLENNMALEREREAQALGIKAQNDEAMLG
ncbi:ribosome biogenesis protein SLX9-domain-containing protein [Geranomyces variabilis]|nr:ribosome biogenesis protein SLX9-domain-containing protein [Geranomyces variabilis]KAJ3141005.1 hypothetical protein HDU90_007028 [Geranomyces variabilis]